MRGPFGQSFSSFSDIRSSIRDFEMAHEPPVHEGKLDFIVPCGDRTSKTWYTIFGDLKSGGRSLVCLQGGPGMSHQCLRPIRFLATLYRTQVILYDQLGSGNSTHLVENAGDGEFWTVELFLTE